jgi:cell division protein FtsB
MLKPIISTLFNLKYTLTVIFFFIWISFFDKNKFSYQWDIYRQIKNLENEKNYYKNEIEKHRLLIHGLSNSPDTMEMIAREVYFMKKENEDIFVLADEKLYSAK